MAVVFVVKATASLQRMTSFLFEVKKKKVAVAEADKWFFILPVFLFFVDGFYGTCSFLPGKNCYLTLFKNSTTIVI
jgi:hypothetical protein